MFIFYLKIWIRTRVVYVVLHVLTSFEKSCVTQVWFYFGKDYSPFDMILSMAVTARLDMLEYSFVKSIFSMLCNILLSAYIILSSPQVWWAVCAMWKWEYNVVKGDFTCCIFFIYFFIFLATFFIDKCKGQKNGAKTIASTNHIYVRNVPHS